MIICLPTCTNCENGDFSILMRDIIIYMHCQELMKLLGGHGSLSLLFMMKVHWSDSL
jgi:hypothetical protein